MRSVIHLKHFADDPRIAAHQHLPIFVAKNEHGGPAMRFIGSHKCSSQKRLDAEHVEEVCGDNRCLHTLGGIFSDQQEVHGVVLRDALKGMILLAILGDFLYRLWIVQHVRVGRILMGRH